MPRFFFKTFVVGTELSSVPFYNEDFSPNEKAILVCRIANTTQRNILFGVKDVKEHYNVCLLQAQYSKTTAPVRNSIAKGLQFDACNLMIFKWGKKKVS